MLQGYGGNRWMDGWRTGVGRRLFTMYMFLFNCINLIPITNLNLHKSLLLCTLPTAGADLELPFPAGEVQDGGSVCGVLLHVEKNHEAGEETPDTALGNHRRLCGE